MKRISAIIVLSVFVLSCSHKTTPLKTETPPANNGSNTMTTPVNDKIPITTPSTTNTSTTSAVASANSPVFGARIVERSGVGNDAAAIAGQAIFNQKCNRCHNYKIPGDYTVDRWISVMQVMAMKATLSEVEKENVLAYVKANAKK